MTTRSSSTSTTPSELVRARRARGLRVTTTKRGRLKVEPRSRLSRDEQEQLRAAGPAILGLLALERGREQDAAEDARQMQELLRTLAERSEAERIRLRLEAMAEWDEAKVLAGIDAGKLSADDVAGWRSALEGLERRFKRAKGMALAANLLGRAARIVRTLDGELAVEVGRPAGHPSTFNGGFFGFMSRTRE